MEKFINGNRPCVIQIILKMKLTAFIFLFAAFSGWASQTYSQVTRFAVEAANMRLEDFLRAVEEKSEYRFFYSGEIDVDQRISGNFNDLPIGEVLDEALKGTGISYEITGRQVVLSAISTPPLVKSQQEGSINGKVLDSSGMPLPGVSISIKGTVKGVLTDADGNFSLSGVSPNDILVFSFVGMKAQEVPAGDRGRLDIIMEEETYGIDEVVAVGYGVQRRESLTGSLQTVSSEKLKDVTTPALENMLNGKAPGVYVSPGSGQPGASGAVIVRGKSTVNGSTNPLWVIDGVIVGSAPGEMNPADVETMTILKDAASTAIYGSQGANGVIVITTKKAKTGKAIVTASAKVGVTSLHKGNLEVMNGAELYDLYNSFSNASEISFPRWNEVLRNSNFNWWDFASKTGVAQDYSITVSGGTERLRSFVSIGVYDEKGAIRGYDYARYNFRFNADYEPFNWLTVKPSISGSRRLIEDHQHSVSAMYSNLPWDSPFDVDGNIVGHKSSLWVNSNSTNYLYDLQWNYAESKKYEFMGNFDFDIHITDYLTFSSVNSFKWGGYSYIEYTDPRSSGGEGVDGRIYEFRHDMERRYTNQLLRFTKMFGNHSINALAAYEFNDYYYKGISATGTGFIPGLSVLDVTSKPEEVTGEISEWAVQSFLLNAHYAYAHKYLAQVSFRRDGASNFGDNAKYGNFFSASAGWNVNLEDWFSPDWVDVLKLRVSYGSVGNRPDALYPQYDLYSASSSYNERPGALISQVGNQDLTWEKTYTTGLGVDASLLGRLRLTLDYYNKKTSNLLYEVPVPGVTGVTEIWRNVGELNNKGFEAVVGVDVIKTNDLLWTIDANIGLNRNKVKQLYGDKAQIIVGDGSDIAGSASKLLKPGLDCDTWYIYEWAGVDPETGKPLWYTTNDKGERETTTKYAEADQVAMSAYTPDFFGGFSTALNYKNFDFNATFGYSVGGKIYNYTRAEYDSDGAYTDRNQMKLQKGWKRWEKAGDIATHPKPSYNNTYSVNSNKVSSRYLEKGSYLKLRNITLGYNFALPDLHISNIRIFLSGENLFTITDYSGVDPEITPRNTETKGSGTDVSTIGKVTGVTTAVYPSTRKFIFGVNVTL